MKRIGLYHSNYCGETYCEGWTYVVNDISLDFLMNYISGYMQEEGYYFDEVKDTKSISAPKYETLEILIDKLL